MLFNDTNIRKQNFLHFFKNEANAHGAVLKQLERVLAMAQISLTGFFFPHEKCKRVYFTIFL